MTDSPLIDIVAHRPRYMVRCSNCGIVAVEQSIKEAPEVAKNHRCPETGTDRASEVSE